MKKISIIRLDGSISSSVSKKKPWILFTSERYAPIIYKGKRFATKEEGVRYLNAMVKDWKSVGADFVQDPRDFYSIEYDPKGKLG